MVKFREFHDFPLKKAYGTVRRMTLHPSAFLALHAISILILNGTEVRCPCLMSAQSAVRVDGWRLPDHNLATLDDVDARLEA